MIYETLDNGIKLYKIKNENVKTVGIGIYVNVGSIYEEKDKRGISHFLEHMQFKTNYKYTGEQIDMGLELNGGIANAFTSHVLTGYVCEFIPENYERIIDILFTALDNKKYLNEEFEREKMVILSEINRTFANPEDKLGILSVKSVYGDSDYGSEVGGNPETIKNIEKEDIEEFKYKYYVPENIYIVVEGNYNEKIIEFIKKKFSKLESNENLKMKNPTKDKGNDIIERMDTQGLVYYSINMNFDIKEYIKLAGLSRVLSGGLSSRVFQIFRNKYGIGYHSSLEFLAEYNDEFIFSLFIPGFEQDKEKYLDDAINDLLDEKIDKDYIDGRKRRYDLIYETQLKNNLYKRLFSADGMLIKLFNKSLDEINKEIQREMDNYEENKYILEELFEKGKEVTIYHNE